MPLVCRDSVEVSLWHEKSADRRTRSPHLDGARVHNGRDPETKKRNYLNQTIHGALRDAQAHLNKMMREQDPNLDSLKNTESVPGSLA